MERGVRTRTCCCPPQDFVLWVLCFVFRGHTGMRRVMRRKSLRRVRGQVNASRPWSRQRIVSVVTSMRLICGQVNAPRPWSRQRVTSMVTSTRHVHGHVNASHPWSMRHVRGQRVVSVVTSMRRVRGQVNAPRPWSGQRTSSVVTSTHRVRGHVNASCPWSRQRAPRRKRQRRRFGGSRHKRERNTLVTGFNTRTVPCMCCGSVLTSQKMFPSRVTSRGRRDDVTTRSQHVAESPNRLAQGRKASRIWRETGRGERAERWREAITGRVDEVVTLISLVTSSGSCDMTPAIFWVG